MNGIGVRWRHASLLIGATLLLNACAGHHHSDALTEEDQLNAYPTNYKTDILGAMHAYLNDPTGIRDGAISQPALKQLGDKTRYVVCLRFNGKQIHDAYAGLKTIAAVFLLGRFDQFVEKANEVCADATYTPFPELGKLTR